MDLGSIFQSINTYIASLSGGNQMVAGALTLWALGVLTFSMKNIPMKTYELIKRVTVTSMTINNGGWGQETAMNMLYARLTPLMSEFWSRSLSITGDWNAAGSPILSLGLGYGVHFLWMDGRIFWANKQKLESSGSERQKDQITLYTFGRSHAPFRKLIAELKPPRDFNRTPIFSFENNYWSEITTIQKRSLDTIAISDQIKTDILKSLTEFEQKKEWFYRAGLAYKLTFIFHGPSGTGKTSLIKALAAHFDRKLCKLNIHDLTDSKLERALCCVPPKSFVLLEDFEESSATKKRVKERNKESIIGEPEPEGDNLFEFLGGLTLSGILNTLDGVIPLDDVIVFLTTNHLEKVDSAVYRDGRVDCVQLIDQAGPIELKKYCETVYPEHDFDDLEFGNVLGCKLNKALLHGKEDPELFIESLVESGCVSYIKEKEEIAA